MPHQDQYMQYRRKSFRLQGYDYRCEGMYFVTICTKDRYPYFGVIQDGTMIQSEIGKIVYENWLKISEFSPHVILDEFVVMPNHIHGILVIQTSVSTSKNSEVASIRNDTKNEFMSAISPKSGSVSRILNSYKGACTKQIRELATSSEIIQTRHDAMAFGWQPKFYDRVIRNDDEWHRIQDYIVQNPINWKNDENFATM
jgi:putative transposase